MPTVPKIIADFTTQLSVAIAFGGTTGTLSSNLDDDGVSLPTGLYYFTVDGNNSNKEHISCTNTGGVLTNIKTVSRQAVETSGAARSHRVGATVVMTDFASFKSYIDNTALQGVSDASTSTKGVVKLSVNSVGDPLAIGNDDPRIPSTAQVSFLTTLMSGLAGVGFPTGRKTAPSGFFFYDGSAVSRASYPLTFAALCPSFTCTITNASPAVVTATAHNMITGDQIHFTTTGSVPNGLAINTDYFISKKDANSFWVFDTRAHAIADNGAGTGTGIINTSSAGSGVHTVINSPYGRGDGSTTFGLPDMRGYVPVGFKSGDDTFTNLGVNFGEKKHQLVTAELASHNHPVLYQSNNAFSSGHFGDPNGGATGTGGPFGSNNLSTQNVGSDTPHNNIQPSVVINWIGLAI